MHVLFELKNKYIYKGENKSNSFFTVTIFQNNIKKMILIRHRMCNNKKYLYKIDKLIKINLLYDKNY
jgi:hypothetical protein